MATSRKNRPAMRLTFSATQGSNDAFKEVEINTGLSTLGGTAYRVLEIGVEIPMLPNVACSMEVTLSRQSQTSIPALDDRSLIYKRRNGLTFTTSGAAWQGNLVERWQPIDAANLILVEEVIYCQLDSTSTGTASTIAGYILIEPLTISEADRTALIAQSLGNF